MSRMVGKFGSLFGAYGTMADFGLTEGDSPDDPMDSVNQTTGVWAPAPVVKVVNTPPPAPVAPAPKPVVVVPVKPVSFWHKLAVDLHLIKGP